MTDPLTRQSRGNSFAARCAFLAAAVLLILTGCRRNNASTSGGEIAFVAGASAELRDELGPNSKVIAHFQSGERVDVLSHRPRWAEVRRSSGESGWVLQRSLVAQDVFDRFAKLDRESEVLPSQGRATIRHDANLHLTPGRATQIFYQLADGELVDVVAHRVVDRDAPAASALPANEDESTDASSTATFKNPEDWLLVRASRNRAGWLLETAADPALPLEIAQYSEGLRIRAWFELYRETDAGQVHPWYLWATARRLGTPNDFDEIRVFVWDPKSARYETSYRERNVSGRFPIITGNNDVAGEPSPTFNFSILGSDGQPVQRNYFMIGRQVKLQK